MKANKGLVSTLAVGLMALALGAAAPTAMAQTDGKPAKTTHQEGHTHKDGKKDKKDDKAVTAGSMAPDFALKDLAGKEVRLSELTKAGKVVVLMWFNPDCPFVVKHFGDAETFNDMHAQFKDKGVELLAINSGAAGKQGAGAERNQKAVTDWKIEFPVLLDDSGTVGKAYGAKRTPEMFIINKDGYIAYHGAIDDDPSDKVGKNNFVIPALNEVLAGKEVTTKTTKPYGCSVKY
jgi:peroxiredoxin